MWLNVCWLFIHSNQPTISRSSKAANNESWLLYFNVIQSEDLPIIVQLKKGKQGYHL